MNSRCAAARESSAVTFPFSLEEMPITLKQTILFTRDIRAISRVFPSEMPIAPFSRLMIPFAHGRSTIRS